MASAGELPQEVYHRSSAIGAGSYGSVMAVYDDEGALWALKVFEEEDDDEDDDDDDDDAAVGGLSLGALREISILRIFREECSHPNIIAIHDVQTAFGEDEEDIGNQVGGVLAMAMPMYEHGSLASAFAKVTTSKKQKAVIAHGILSAVAHLHANGIIHRDIKSDNVLLRHGDDEDDLFHPVLIDFSLAKVTRPALIMGLAPALMETNVSSTVFDDNCNGFTHTPSVGTPTYRAPEVVAEEPYGLSSDMWSVGVVLLELLRGQCLESFKDKGATLLVAEYLEQLPLGQPFPALLRGLLEPDPAKRWTAQQALDCELFHKFSLMPKTPSMIYLPDAVPLEMESDLGVDTCRPATASLGQACVEGMEKEVKKDLPKKLKKVKGKIDPLLSKGWALVQKVCKWMKWDNPITSHAAMTYSRAMAELMDEDEGPMDDLKKSQTLLDCIVAAHKFFEAKLSSRTDVNSMYQQFAKTDFDADEFANNESTLFMMMDFCMYPRTVGLGYYN